MIDAERMLGSLVRSAMTRGGSPGGRRRRRRSRKSLLGGAGKGALALGALGVAIAAFEHFSEKQGGASRATASGPTPPPPPAPTDRPPQRPLPAAAPPPPPPPSGPPAAAPATEASRDDALLLVRAMIAAANADHQLDEEERRRILEALAEADASEEDKAFVRQELENPIALASLAGAATSPELASQIYLASCLAIDVDTEAERNYLDRLAQRLGLEAERASKLEEMVAGEAERGAD